MPNKIVDRENLKEFRERIDEKYVIEGEYSPDTWVGMSDNIYTNREIDDIDEACSPITFGSTGGNAEIQTGLQKFEEMYGNSVKWNQLFINNNNPVSVNLVGSIEPEYNDFWLASADYRMVLGHKYLIKFDSVPQRSANANKIYITTVNNQSNLVPLEQNYAIFTVLSIEVDTRPQLIFYVNQGGTITYDGNVQIFDLTEIYGAGKEPADIVYFNRDYTLPYYSYNAGELLSCKSSSMDSIGCNQFQALNEYVEVIAGETYHISGISAGGYIEEYDGGKNLIKTSEEITSATYIELSANTHFVKVQATNYSNIMFRLYYDTDNVPYAPFEKTTVALPNVDIRSVPDYANDGVVRDVLYSTGGGKRRIQEVDLGDLYWNPESLYTGYSTGIQALVKKPSAYNVKANILCAKYETVNEGQISGGDNRIAISTTGAILINDSSLTGQTATEIKTALSGFYLFYELAEETDITTEENPGWTTLVKFDNYGTIKFNSSQTVQIPQPYFVRYTVSLSEWLDTAYDYSNGVPSNLALQENVDKKVSKIALTNIKTTQLVLTGASSESWSTSGTYTNVIRFNLAGSFPRYADAEHYRGIGTATCEGITINWIQLSTFGDVNEFAMCFVGESASTIPVNSLIFLVPKSQGITTVEQLRTWLSTNNITVEYQVGGDYELIGSLVNGVASETWKPHQDVDLSDYAKTDGSTTFTSINFGDGAIISKDSSQRIVLKYSNSDKLKIGSANLNISARLDPDSNNTYDLGRSGVAWRDLYLSRNLTDGTNSVSVANISNGLFNVINASDIVNNTLTQAQYDLITNGKPTLIKGTFRNLTNPILYSGYATSSYYFGQIQGYYNAEYQYLIYYINLSTKLVEIDSSRIAFNLAGNTVVLNRLQNVNGKNIPNYPSSTGTFVLKCVNGTLTWVQE